ncbi:DUF4105 domain-containing protein [Photobacterium proteolyticum]|uniref:lipoprotein N-acyltransferase Lnb domain-containing protein n=1 Tax=Photobacterium proteolyticum TaxID=1903952 RepID=UPI0011153992
MPFSCSQIMVKSGTSGYLGKPASMYGHLLIKLNNQESSELLENHWELSIVDLRALYRDNQ